MLECFMLFKFKFDEDPVITSGSDFAKNNFHFYSTKNIVLP
jgi:hypothetical protein